MKKDQPIWPEWTGENTAEDIGGRKYVRDEEGHWSEVTDAEEETSGV